MPAVEHWHIMADKPANIWACLFHQMTGTNTVYEIRQWRLEIEIITGKRIVDRTISVDKVQTENVLEKLRGTAFWYMPTEEGQQLPQIFSFDLQKWHSRRLATNGIFIHVIDAGHGA